MAVTNILALAITTVLYTTVVGDQQQCHFPVDDLPTITELYYQPSADEPSPTARVTFTSRYPVIHSYWLVVDGRYGWNVNPKYPSYYPVYDSYNGVLSHYQELSPRHSQFVLYSDHQLSHVKLRFVLDIGCNIVIYTVVLDIPGRGLEEEIDSWKILNAVQREHELEEEGQWVSWKFQAGAPPRHSRLINAHLGVYAYRNGTSLSPRYSIRNPPFSERNVKKSYTNDDVPFDKSAEIRLKPGVSEIMAYLHCSSKIIVKNSMRYVGFNYPFSTRIAAEESAPAIVVDLCDYREIEIRDDGSPEFSIRRRSDTPGCVRVHIHGKPFPEYTIKDLETGDVIPNWPYRTTPTYTTQNIRTAPIPSGESRNYEIVARNSHGLLTRRLKLIGYTENVLSIKPDPVYISGKRSVQLQCEAGGDFKTLGLYSSTFENRWSSHRWNILKEVPASEQYAELRYDFSNFSTVITDGDVEVFCALNREEFRDVLSYEEERQSRFRFED